MVAAANALPASDAETKRIEALRKYDILDSPPDGNFDRITAVAASIFSVPIAIISLVDHDRIWFKSHHGLDIDEIGRDPGLCASCILHDNAWILTDAKTDVRALANPLVAGDFGLRFYAGVPLRTRDGHNLGTLCVIGREPREVTEREVAQLADLASVVVDQMELRLSARSTIFELQKAIAEKDMLAREIDHRVTNSLQLVSSLLTVQSRIVGEEAAEQLSRAAHRVSAVGRVHQYIYLNDSPGNVDCLIYLQSICNDLADLLDEGDLTVDGDKVNLPAKYIVPLGLIATEMVTNAAKNGARQVNVSLLRRPLGKLALTVTDDGKGLPENFKPGANGGLGMKIIQSLLLRFHGELDFGPPDGGGPGARFTVLFDSPG